MTHRLYYLILALALVATGATAQLISETFDTAGSSATFDADLVPGGDHTATFGFDYSALTISAAGTPVDATTIPEAPNTPGGATATRGLAMQVNLAGAATSESLFTATSVSGDYVASVDVFYYHDGNSGSTEDAMVGINHSGTYPIAFQVEGAITDQTDGYFFKTHGDVDVSGNDHFLLEGANGAIVVSPEPGITWADGQNAGSGGRHYGVPLFQNSATGYPWGATAPGGAFRWVWQTVEIQSLSGIVTLRINDAPIATYDDPDDTFSAGKIMLGHEDSYNGANTGNYVIFDNLVVTEITVTDVGDYSLYH